MARMKDARMGRARQAEATMAALGMDWPRLHRTGSSGEAERG